MLTQRPLPRLAFGPGGPAVPGSRALPEEVAVALSFNGSTQAVMMATPADLEDFAYGFALTEGLARPDEIESLDCVETPRGVDLQIWVAPRAAARLAERRRSMMGPVGCGLCGIDSLDQAMRALPRLERGYTLAPAEVRAAMAALPRAQPLHDATHAVHAAGYWNGGLQMLREDVGRHNALDKLAGALLRGGAPQGQRPGAVVLTSRVSIDMVQKVAMLGVSVLIAVSAPTAHAVALAEDCGLTLIALARPDRFEVFTHDSRLTGGPAAGEPHVA